MGKALAWISLLLTGVLAGCGAPPPEAGVVDQEAVRPAQNLTYQGPITIERGGTYRGNWESLDPNVPAVLVNTEEPVVIEYSNIRGKGALIEAPNNHTDITVRHTRAEGLNPGVRGRSQGRFIQTHNGAALIVEHNEVVGTLGIHVNTYQGKRDGAQTVKVRYNRFRNLMGQASDGQGGYLGGGTGGQDFDVANLVQLYDVKDVPGIEIVWNEVINEPRKSRAEDVISFCRSGGTAQSQAEVHDNYIQGNRAYDPSERTFSGAGINVGDCGDGTLFGHVRVYGNQVVGFASGGIGITGGHDQEVFGNRVVSAGQLADGTHYPALGVSVWDYLNQGPGLFFNNRSHDNVVGVVRRDGPDVYRCDGWWPQESKQADGGDTWCKSGWYDNVSLPDPITPATEQAEYVRWQDKLAASGLTLGPVGTPGLALAVTVYADAHQQGTSQRFGIGSYNSADLNAVGNDRISSISVPAGLRLRACQHDGGAGLCRDFPAGEYGWPGDDLNDQISHLDVTAAP